jgi:hypothetical protein
MSGLDSLCLNDPGIGLANMSGLVGKLNKYLHGIRVNDCGVRRIVRIIAIGHLGLVSMILRMFIQRPFVIFHNVRLYLTVETR